MIGIHKKRTGYNVSILKTIQYYLLLFMRSACVFYVNVIVLIFVKHTFSHHKCLCYALHKYIVESQTDIYIYIKNNTKIKKVYTIMTYS